MDLISVLISVIIFAVVAYGAWWVCQHFGMPPPVFWLIGAVLLIVLVLYLARVFGISTVWPVRR